MIKRAMSPVWEANHVWLIFVLVVLWTAFPEAFGSLTSTLAIPLFLAALGIVLRGGAFALKGEAATIAEARALGATFALSSVLVPFFLGASAGAIAAGEVPLGNAAGDEWGSWTGTLPIFVGLLAVVDGRASGGRLPRRRLAPSRPAGARPRLPRAGARLRARGGRARDRGPRDRELRGTRPVRRPHLRCRAGLRDRLRVGGASRRSRSSGASASSRRATQPPRRWPRSSPGGHSRRSRTCCRRAHRRGGGGSGRDARRAADRRHGRDGPADSGAGVALPARAQRPARLRG